MVVLLSVTNTEGESHQNNYDRTFSPRPPVLISSFLAVLQGRRTHPQLGIGLVRAELERRVAALGKLGYHAAAAGPAPCVLLHRALEPEEACAVEERG